MAWRLRAAHGGRRIILAVLLSGALIVAADAKTFRWANDGDANSMDPYARQETFLLAFDHSMYEPLVRRNREMRLEPGLATEWTQAAPTVWRFKLRQGVKFHDGTPFTADDVVFSFDRATHPGSNLASPLATIREVKKIDDFTVELLTDEPDPILPYSLPTFAIMSKKWCEEHNTIRAADLTKQEESYATRNANGTGPFMLKERQPDIRTVLVKNPDWWGRDSEPVDLDEVVFSRIEKRRDAHRGTAVGRTRHGLYRAAARHRPDRQDRRHEGVADAGAADDLSRHGPEPRRAARIQCQGQEPVQGQAGAPGLHPGDRRERDRRQGDARLCPSDRAVGRAWGQRLRPGARSARSL
jgi:hypothetical protein